MHIHTFIIKMVFPPLLSIQVGQSPRSKETFDSGDKKKMVCVLYTKMDNGWRGLCFWAMLSLNSVGYNVFCLSILTCKSWKKMFQVPTSSLDTTFFVDVVQPFTLSALRISVGLAWISVSRTNDRNYEIWCNCTRNVFIVILKNSKWMKPEYGYSNITIMSCHSNSHGFDS